MSISTRIDPARLLLFTLLMERDWDRETICKAMKIKGARYFQYQAEYRRVKRLGEKQAQDQDGKPESAVSRD
jgi:hypothetical protein